MAYNQLRVTVLKDQLHSCQLKHTLCRYDFPYALLKEDGLNESGIRYDARFECEDVKVVVLYNRELLKAWDAHINVQRVTQLGLVRYLVTMLLKLSLHSMAFPHTARDPEIN